MSSRFFILLGVLGLIPWLIWQQDWPNIVITRLDHCPTPLCDFQRHYLPQAETLLVNPLKLVFGWFYPPLLAILLIPLSWSASPVVFWFIFLLMTLSALCWFALTPQNKRPLPFVMSLLFVSSSLPILHGLKWGQVSLPLVLLCFLGLIRGGPIGGALLGIATAIKGYPFVYLLHPLLKNKIRPIVAAASSFLIFGLLLPFALIGFENTLYMYQNMSQNSAFVIFYSPEAGGQSLHALLHRWFIEGSHVKFVDTAPLLFSLPHLVKQVLWLVISGALTWVTLRIIRRDDSERTASTILIFCYIGILLPPGWHHYYAFLPLGQLLLLQRKQCDSVTLLLLGASILFGHTPTWALGFFENAYFISSAYGTTAISTILCWAAWARYTSSKTPINTSQMNT